MTLAKRFIIIILLLFYYYFIIIIVSVMGLVLSVRLSQPIWRLSKIHTALAD